MNYKHPRTQPETIGANRLRNKLLTKGWTIIDKVGGSVYTTGWPDLFCFHPTHGVRWIETKALGGKLKPSQVKRFDRWRKAGLGVYVLENEKHYYRLFKPPNWENYIRGV